MVSLCTQKLIKRAFGWAHSSEFSIPSKRNCQYVSYRSFIRQIPTLSSTCGRINLTQVERLGKGTLQDRRILISTRDPDKVAWNSTAFRPVELFIVR